MRKLLSVLVSLIVVMALVSCTNDAEVSIANSFGYEEVARVIESAEDFVAFANEVVAGNSFAGEVVVLNRDITLSAEEFVPAGNSENPFEGIFDGGNNTITYSSNYDADEEVYLGLFGTTYNAELKNLNVVVDADTDASNSFVLAFGGIIGYASGDLTLSNINIKGSITSYDNVGGLVGILKGEENTSAVIENCKSRVNLTSYVKTGSFELRDEDGNVVIEDYDLDVKVGGLLGSVKDAEVEINDCSYSGQAESGKWVSVTMGSVEASEVYVSILTCEGCMLSGETVAEKGNLAYFGYSDKESEVYFKDSAEEEWTRVALAPVEEN